MTLTEADNIAAQISRADRAHEWAIAEAQKAAACEQRVTVLRVALNDIIALGHHWHGQEGRATEIARAALLRDDDMAAR